MPDIDFVKAEASRMWQAAAEWHARGYMSRAVDGWAKCTEYQRGNAVLQGLDPHLVYLTDAGWTFPFGHLSALEVFVKMKRLGMTDDDYMLLIEHDKPMDHVPGGISNRTYYNLISKHFEIKEKSTFTKDVKLMEYYMTVLKIDGKWEWFMDAWSIIEDRWRAKGFGSLVELSPEQVAEGQQKLSLEPTDWFVTLHARSFTNDLQGTRNSDLSAYNEAIKLIGQAGGKVFTVPSGDKDLDIYLLAKARFVIAGNSGPAYLAGSFGVPVLFINFFPIGIKYPYKKVIFNYKKLWTVDKNRALKDEEYREPFIHVTSNATLAEYGLTTIQNTSEEVLEGVKQMMDRKDWYEN